MHNFFHVLRKRKARNETGKEQERKRESKKRKIGKGSKKGKKQAK